MNQNDSGISPGRSSSSAQSTSPHSPQRPRGSPDSTVFSSAYNGRSSPQESNSNRLFPPSPLSLYPRSPCSPSATSSPPERSSEPPPLERLEHSPLLAAIYKQGTPLRPGNTVSEPPKKEFSCPLCAYTSPYR